MTHLFYLGKTSLHLRLKLLRAQLGRYEDGYVLRRTLTPFCIMPTLPCIVPTLLCIVPTLLCIVPTLLCIVPTLLCITPTLRSVVTVLSSCSNAQS